MPAELTAAGAFSAGSSKGSCGLSSAPHQSDLRKYAGSSAPAAKPSSTKPNQNSSPPSRKHVQASSTSIQSAKPRKSLPFLALRIIHSFASPPARRNSGFSRRKSALKASKEYQAPSCRPARWRSKARRAGSGLRGQVPWQTRPGARRSSSKRMEFIQAVANHCKLCPRGISKKRRASGAGVFPSLAIMPRSVSRRRNSSQSIPGCAGSRRTAGVPKRRSAASRVQLSSRMRSCQQSARSTLACAAGSSFGAGSAAP